MSLDTEILEELQMILEEALFQLQELTNDDNAQQADFMQLVVTFLQDVILATIDLTELSFSGFVPDTYVNIEAIDNLEDNLAIKKMLSENCMASYSVSDIVLDDKAETTNYLSDKLLTDLFIDIHELLQQLHNRKMLLRGIEFFLDNLSYQEFENPFDMLESFQKHLSVVLNDMEGEPLARIH
ncbi:MAG: hypothetical protein K2Y08_07245 [Alphaproteobacteria bacterium]|nr:hypothetical protein [Alphaproteobacteria bacterium]